ncbi:30S ribosomal protein S16 [Exophiala aquamarina CBS 119918]|uniref:30S ribosomal protein S16 n=1 Tax=Exophiala aquamarina CBS 119918 TaxID=1182545 RepID=A0A072PK17_9EURO|nr:30S ribosomal protein S16 [Exophiala aquamarina CBS 119918]KEF60449.1 30S ribosomal protein S16 [Exophiala aquamarina CBS 119918]
MVLRIRLARFGTKRKPIYNIVLSQAKTARNSKPMEVLGTYNPIPQTPLASHDTPEFTPGGEKFKPKKYKDIKLDTVRTKYWLGVGAQPTEPVEKLLCMVSAWSPLVRIKEDGRRQAGK